MPNVSAQQWVYEPSADGSARFVLGTVGSNPLVCFGINPSTAVPNALDRTVTRVQGFAETHGYDSWTMLNVYPQIDPKPENLHRKFDPQLKAENERLIAKAIQGRQTLLAAWGRNITARTYLRSMLRDILQLTNASGATWLSLGPTTIHGHPRHPLYLHASTPIVPFDMTTYRWARP